jgi:hypothetical protein
MNGLEKEYTTAHFGGQKEMKHGAIILEFPRVHDMRGNLSFIENGNHVPFQISRVYWVYDVPGGEVRGGHAHRQLEEIIIALSGSFDVAVDDGSGAEQLFHLNRSYRGLYVPRLHWRQLRHFSTNAVALILASLPFDESDYLYNYNEFMSHIHAQTHDRA